MVDIVSVLSLQGRARRNAKTSLRILQRQRAERADAARVAEALPREAAPSTVVLASLPRQDRGRR